jgi:hypothetical protein
LAAGLLQRASQHELQLAVEAAQLVVGPALQCGVEGRVKPEQEGLAFRHGASVSRAIPR